MNERQAAASVARSAGVFGGVAFDEMLGQSVDFQDDDALDLGLGGASRKGAGESAGGTDWPTLCLAF